MGAKAKGGEGGEEGWGAESRRERERERQSPET